MIIETKLEPERENFDDLLGRLDKSKTYKYIENYPFLRPWNEQFVKFLSNIVAWNKPDQFVKVVYLNPERAFLKIVNPPKEGQFALPIISCVASDISFNLERYKPHFSDSYFIKKKIDSKNWDIYQRALPYDISYNVYVMCRTKEEIEFIVYQIVTRFNPVCYIYLDSLPALLTLESITEESELEYGEEQRVIVNSINIKCEAWISVPHRTVKQIEEVNITTDFLQ